MTWKEKVDPSIKTHLERQIGESIKHREAYENAKNPANAQLWITIANLSKEIFDINLKLNYLEKAIKNIAPKLPKKKQIKKVKKKISKK